MSLDTQLNGGTWAPEKSKPIGPRVLVRLTDLKRDLGVAKIEVPDVMDRRKAMTGTVVAKGPETKQVKIGDLVLLPGNAAIPVVAPGEKIANDNRHVLIVEQLLYAILA